MSENEIIQEFKRRYINLKVNNYIFCGLDNFEIINKIPETCSISIAECYINIEYAQNIKIDLSEVSVKDILSYTLQVLKDKSLLDVTLDYDIELNNKFDLLKFQSILRNYHRAVQLIFYNVEKLDLEEQMLFNELYYFNSIFFNANSFIKGNNFLTYFLSNERVLDNRENYEKVKKRNDFFKVKWSDIPFLVSKIGYFKDLNDEELIRELLQTYYDGLEENKSNGFVTNELIVKNKPKLYEYLSKNGKIIFDEKERKLIKTIGGK